MGSFDCRVDGFSVASVAKVLGLSCFAGLVLVIGAPLALAEPAPLTSRPEMAAGHAPAVERPRLAPRPEAPHVRVVVTPLDLVRLNSAAFADWDDTQPQR